MKTHVMNPNNVTISRLPKNTITWLEVDKINIGQFCLFLMKQLGSGSLRLNWKLLLNSWLVETFCSTLNLSHLFNFPELEFEMPKYLMDLTKGSLIENLWWPSFAAPIKTRRSIDLEIDISKLELEDVGYRNEFVGKIKWLFFQLISAYSPSTHNPFVTPWLLTGKEMSYKTVIFQLKKPSILYLFRREKSRCSVLYLFNKIILGVEKRKRSLNKAALRMLRLHTDSVTVLWCGISVR